MILMPLVALIIRVAFICIAVQRRAFPVGGLCGIHRPPGHERRAVASGVPLSA